MRLAVIFFALASVTACTKSEEKKKDDQGTVGADGVRHIPVEAGKKGYSPDVIKAKPGEKLVLVFTRTVEGDCLSQVKVADGPLVDLPMNKPVEVAVTAPESGKLAFVCGMDMQHGEIAVQ